jgi:transposase
MTVAITRTELGSRGLRAAATRSQDAAAARWMLAPALVLEGHNRTDAARAAGMARQKLRDWVHRYNERGVEGLKNLPEKGVPPRKLSAEQEAAVAAWIRQGPTFEEHKVIRWRLTDLRDEIAGSSACTCTSARWAS